MTEVHDWSVPELQDALDADRVVGALRERWAHVSNAPAIEKGHVVDVRYRPDRPCWLLYRFRLRTGRRSPRWQLFAGRLMQPGDAPPEPPPPSAVERYVAQHDPPVPTPFVVLDDCRVALYAFPIDEALPGLFDALDETALAAQLARDWIDGNARIRGVRARPLGYTPWARAAVEYEVLAERGHMPEIRRFIGKLHAAKPAARRFADAWAVWRGARGRIGLAPPAGYLGRIGVTLQEQVRGVRLGALVGSPKFTARARQAAPMLATLHGLALPLATRRTAADEAASVHRWAALLQLIRPDLDARILSLRDEIAAGLDARAELAGPVHADFHHTNLLVDDDRLTIIDFDEMAIGDPLVDVGRFLASLRIPALRAFGDPAALAPAGAAFLEAYLARAPHDITRVRLFEAAALVTASASAFRIQRPNWRREIDLLIAEAERAAAAARAGAVHFAISPARPRAVAARQWLEDPVFMRAVLDPFVRETYDADLVACRVTSAGSARRSGGVELELRGWRHDQRWHVRVDVMLDVASGRSLVRRLRAVEHALADAAHAPRLPRPVASLPSLSAVVLQMPPGVPLSEMLAAGETDALAAAEAAGRSLAELHRLAEPPQAGPGPIHAGPSSTRQKPFDPDDLDPGLRPLAVRIGDAVGRLPAIERQSLRRLAPRHVLWHHGHIGFDRIEGIGLANPLHDAADFLSRLVLLGHTQTTTERCSAAADRFRDAYLRHVNAEWSRHLAVFEAAALLRLASKQPQAADLLAGRASLLAAEFDEVRAR